MPLPERVSFKGMSSLALFPIANGYRVINTGMVANVSGHRFISHFFHHEFYKLDDELHSTRD